MANKIKINRGNFMEKSTIFRINLEKVRFMYDGMFLLKLTINNSLLSDKSGVRLRTKNSEKFLKDFSVRTEILGPLKKETFSNFTMDEYSFYLPKGFCKNDMDHEVYLQLDALQVLQDAKTQLIGSVKLPIYPRSDAKANYDVERGEPFYQTSGSIRLLRPNIQESSLHCGDLFYKAEFSEIIEILEPEMIPPPRSMERTPEPVVHKPKSPLPFPTQTNDSPKKIIDVSSDFIESEPLFENPNQDSLITVGTSPPKTPDLDPELIPPPANNRTPKNVYNLLSPKDQEEISIFVRGAEDVLCPQHFSGLTYVTCTLKTDKMMCDSTHDSASSSPVWEEILNLPYPPEKIERILSLRIIGGHPFRTISEYLLPIKSLRPFHHYHLKLCQAFPAANTNPVLYVTIVRKLDHYPLSGKEYTFSALIIKPLTLFHQLYSVSKHSLSCFCYLSNDKTQKISKIVQCIDDIFVLVQSPVSSNYSFSDHYSESRHHPMWSSGQLSIPSISSQREYEAWNFPFLFCERPEMDTAFTANSFVVLDFYSFPSSAGMTWINNPPVAQSILKLDKLLFRQLHDKDKRVINKYDFDINWKTLSLWTVREPNINRENVEKGNEISIKIFLTKENISDNISYESDTLLPTVENEKIVHQKKKSIPKLVEKEPFLYKIRPLRSPNLDDQIQINDKTSPLIKNPNKSKKDVLYQNSLRKMQLELMNLREQYRTLKSENEGLESRVLLKRSEGTKKYDPTIQQVDHLSKYHLYERYDTLRRKVGTQLSILAEVRAKEKELRTTMSTDMTQDSSPDLYKKLKLVNESLKKLENNATENENLISELENILDGKESYQERADENNAAYNNQYSDDERNQLYDLIERSENRIKVLQDELIDISRKRGARKQMMNIRELEKLSPYEHSL